MESVLIPLKARPRVSFHAFATLVVTFAAQGYRLIASYSQKMELLNYPSVL